MRDLKILAWVHHVTGAITVLFALFLFSALVQEDVVIGGVIGSLILLKGVTSLLPGWALLALKPWSRVFGKIVSVLQLPFFPVGTAIGIFGWIVLDDLETQRLLTAGAEAPSRARLVRAGG